jgi:hypothetical protein
MSIEVIDIVDLAHKERRRKNVFQHAAFPCLDALLQAGEERRDALP